jgi:type I site-specific restriction endonuclease
MPSAGSAFPTCRNHRAEFPAASSSICYKSVDWSPLSAKDSAPAMNEEEVKIKKILPWLEHRVSQADLSYETSVPLPLGRYSNRRRSASSRRARSGRVDILVKRGGRNLLVVETKREGHALNEKDRDQALLYAKMLDPMVPLALVTNGYDFRLYDTPSGEPVPDGTPIDERFSVSLSAADRAEALRLFLSYSRENLMAFCSAQIEEQLHTLVGSATDTTKKYVPELYAPPSGIMNVVPA